MRTSVTLAALCVSAMLVLCAEAPRDLTGTGQESFKAQIGKVVSLRGQLEQGMQGPYLLKATATNVVFYVIPDVPTNGSYGYPASWTKLMHKQVRVTGELRFRSFNRKGRDPLMQIPADYYFMVLQRTRVEGFEKK